MTIKLNRATSNFTDFDPADVEFDEFGEIDRFDDSFNIGKVFYEETPEG